MKDISYKGHTLTFSQLPNFGDTPSSYRAISILENQKWVRDAIDVSILIKEFKSHIDWLENAKVYEQVKKEWGSSYKIINYKSRGLSITVKQRRDGKAVYLGQFYCKDYRRVKSIESIHYDKVVSKFKRFVDEYCTDWVYFKSEEYKGYALVIKKERDKNSYFGTSYIHKNSSFKCISDCLENIIGFFQARIDQVVYQKEKAKMSTFEQEKIHQIQEQIYKLQQELEEVKSEKKEFTYKGVVLKYGKEEGLDEGYFIGRIKNAAEGTKEFYARVPANMQVEFKKYIDELQISAKLYCELTNKRMIFNN